MKLRLVAIASILVVALTVALGMYLLEYLNAPHTATEKTQASWQRENNYLYQQARATHGLPQDDQLARVDSNSDRDTAGKPTVLLLGDSTTYGTGLENLDMTWARILERTSDYHIVAYARPGASTTDYAHWLEHLVTTHQADAVVIAQTFNDHIPSPQTLQRLCQQGDCQPRLLETHPQYLECFNSANVVTARLGQEFPNLTRNVGALNCDPEQLSRELDLPRVGDYRTSPETFPYLPEYNKAVKAIAQQTLPTAVIPVSASVNDETLGAYYLQAYSETPIEVLRATSIDRLIAEPNPRQRTANPADEHPGTALHAAYAQTVLRHLDSLNLKQSTAGNGADHEAGPAATRWLGTSLPANLTVYEHQDGRTEITYTSSGLGDGQATACARTGYPHLRINLTQPGTYTLASSNRKLRASAVDYDQGGLATTPLHLGELEPGSSLTFRITSYLGGSLLLGDPTAQCPETGAIDIESAAFTIAQEGNLEPTTP